MIRKIPISEVPTEEDECAKFVYEMYSEKVCQPKNLNYVCRGH